MHSYGSDGNISYHHPINKDMSFTVRANYTFSENIVDNLEEPLYAYGYREFERKAIQCLAWSYC